MMKKMNVKLSPVSFIKYYESNTEASKGDSEVKVSSPELMSTPARRFPGVSKGTKSAFERAAYSLKGTPLIGASALRDSPDLAASGNNRLQVTGSSFGLNRDAIKIIAPPAKRQKLKGFFDQQGGSGGSLGRMNRDN